MMNINNIMETLFLIFAVLSAFLAINAKSLIESVIYLSFLSLLAVLGFVLLKAPDVAITEAVIGSGLTTVIFVFTLLSAGKVGDRR